MEIGKVKRLDATQKALDLIDMLESKFGPLMFYRAGGCCEGTQPQCFEKGGFFTRTNDVCIGNMRISPLMSLMALELEDFH